MKVQELSKTEAYNIMIKKHSKLQDVIAEYCNDKKEPYGYKYPNRRQPFKDQTHKVFSPHYNANLLTFTTDYDFEITAQQHTFK